MLKRTRVSAALAAAFGSGMLLSSLPSVAQQTLERVEVTGSRIKRVDAETASPVQVITREEIEKSGATTVSDVVRGLTADNNGSIPTSFQNGFAAGASAVSLRGLGVNSTLILLNGRRLAPYGLADDGQRNFTDLSSIPLDAIDRIDVLKDGASAIYGADAVGGVINIILRSSFQGMVANVSGGATRYGDGKNMRASVTGGFGDLLKDGFNIFGNLEASKQDAIMLRDRYERGLAFKQDPAAAGYDYFGTAGAPGIGYLIPGLAINGGLGGAVRDASGGFNYRFLPCPSGTGAPPASAVAQYPELADNYSSQNGSPASCWSSSYDWLAVQPKEERLNMFVRGTLQLGPEWQAFSEISRFQTKVSTYFTPSSVSGSWPNTTNNTLNSNAGITIADTHPDNPYAPDGAANRLRYVTGDLGGRNNDYDTVQTRLLAGLKGSAAGWDLETGAMYSNSKTERVQNGYLRNSVLRDYLSGTNVTGLNPNLTFYRLGVNAGLNSAATRAAISPTLVNNLETSLHLFDVRASRDLMKLDGGNMALALGGEYRREQLSGPATPYTNQADIVALGFSEFFGDRTVGAVFGEVVAPVTKQFEISAALRMDKYSDFGTSTTPKIGLKYAPIRELVIRGTYAEAFRAPGPAENGSSSSAGFTSADDPLLCDGTAGNQDCGRTVIISSIGNPQIKPEKAKSYTLGLVFEPTEDTNASVDFWLVDRKNEINGADAQQVLDDPTSIPGATIIRQDDGRGLLTPIGGGTPVFAVAGVLAPYFNAAKTRTYGVDFDVRQRFKLGDMGRITAGVIWTHLISFKRTFPNGTSVEYADSHGPTALSGNGGTPKDRITVTGTWDFGPWSTTGRLNYVGAFQNKETADDTDCLNHYFDGSDAPGGCKIPSFYTVDLALKWSGIKNLEIYGGIKNLFDKKAPYDPQVYSSFNYNAIYHMQGAIGRSYNVGLKYSFF